MNQNLNNINFFNESPKPFSHSRFFSNIAAQIAGVYKFYNPIENGYYIGQSTNLADRFVRHSNDLANNCHSNSGLQNAFNKIKENNQDPYQIISCEIIYQLDLMILPDTNKYKEIIRDLKNKESECITLYRQDKDKKVYNFVQEERVEINVKPSKVIKKKLNKNVKPCQINDIQYSRIGQALAALKGTPNQVSRETLIKRLNDSSFPNWKSLNCVPEFENHQSSFSREKISMDSDSKVNLPSPVKFTDPVTNKVIVFPSIRKCVNELKSYFNSLDKKTYQDYEPFNIKINNPSITRRCNKTSDYNNIFSWASPSEINSSLNFENFLPKKVSGKNKVYSSISEAAKKQGVSRLTIMNWCNNLQNNEWFYCD